MGGDLGNSCNELVEYVADRMSSGIHKHALYAQLQKDLGCSIDIKAYEELRRRAESLNRDRMSNRPTELGNAVAWYKSVIADDTVKSSDKLRARQQLDKILGLEHVQGSTEDQVEVVRRAVEKMRGT